jgi:GTP cyclohydrolase II
MNIRLATRELKTKYGTFREVLYYDGQRESIALVMGEVAGEVEVLCRVHSACLSGHVFNSIECDCADQFEAAQQTIQKAGRGLIIYLDQEGKGNGHLALMLSIPYKKELDQAEAYKKAGYEADARSYRAAAEILADLQVESIIMLTGNPEKAEDLRRESIIVAGTKDTV